MIAIDKVLFPTDFSETANLALKRAVDAARFFDAELHLLHVVEPTVTGRLSQTKRDYDRLLSRLEQEVETLVHDALEKAPEAEDRARVPVRTFLRRTDEAAPETAEEAAPGILAHAREQGVDLVVMATHGRRGIRKLLLGSVTDEVVRCAECPVLTLRSPDRMKPLFAVEKILVPIDFSNHAAEALRWAQSAAEQLGARIELLHVVAHPAYPHVYVAADPGAVPPEGLEMSEGEKGRLLTKAEEELTRLVEGLETTRVDYDVLALEGRPAKRIVECAEQGSSDLIVIASRGLSGVHRFLLGSVTESVIREAGCPVVVVKS